MKIPFKSFKKRDPGRDESLAEKASLPIDYPTGTPGEFFFRLSPKEVLVLVRGVREAAVQFRTTIQGLLLGRENVDPTAFQEILPLLLCEIQDQWDYEAYPSDELAVQAADIYLDPKNASLALPVVLTMAMKALNGGQDHRPQSEAHIKNLNGQT